MSDNASPEALKFIKLNHINAIVDGYQSAVEHFVGRLGLQFNMEVNAQGDDVDACLASLGPVMFEFFAPHRRTKGGQGRLLDLYGDHYIGAEYQVADIDAARSACQALGIRILNDRGHFLFTHPRDSFGISWELWEGDWQAPGPDFDRFTNLHPASYWRQHPLGVTGLACMRAAVPDVEVAGAFFESALGATVAYRAHRPAVSAQAIGVNIGDTVIELLGPDGDGELTAFLDRYGPRLRSTVFTVLDLERARRHVESAGVPLVPGDDNESWLLEPGHNHGLRFELTAR